MTYEWVCDYCDSVFDTKEECDKHEETCKSRGLKVTYDFNTMRAKGRLGEFFIRNLFEITDGYKIIPFGVETRSEEVKDLIRSNFKTDTNKKIKSLPDFIVVDKEKEESHLIEVKHPGIKFFDESKTQFMFKWGVIQDLIKYWKEAVLVIALNCEPHCLCVKVSDIEPDKHLKFSKHVNGKPTDYWSFEGLYTDIRDAFPLIKGKDFMNATKIFRNGD